MAGGGMGGVSSSGYGQPTGQNPFGGQMYDSTNSTSYPSTTASSGSATGPNLLSLLAPPGAVTSPNGTQGLFGNQQPVFNAQYYLQQNPDVAKNEVYGKNPYQHYLDYGKAEGRAAYDAAHPGYFDPNFYLQQNADVAKAGVDPYQHYLQFGQMEGRAGYNADAPVFNNPMSQVMPSVVTGGPAQIQQLSFNTPTVSQSGDTGGAMNYQYRRGGIASLLRR